MGIADAGPLLEEFSVPIKDLDGLIFAIAHIDAALVIDGEGVRQVEPAGASSVFSPSLAVITVAIELHDARTAGGIELEHKMAAIIGCSKLVVGGGFAGNHSLGEFEEVRDNPVGKLGNGLKPGRFGSCLPGCDLEGQKGDGCEPDCQRSFIFPGVRQTYFPPSTSLAIVASCMLDVPS
jgi:hypothetical protein